MTVEIRPATGDELPGLAAIMGRAFRDDPMLAWTFAADGREERIRRYFEVLDRFFVDLGWVWTTDDCAGVAVWVPPGSDEEYERASTIAQPDVEALTDDGGARYDAFWAWIDQHKPAEPHWYLDQIAVAPERQGEGIGVALVTHGLELAHADGAPAFLVTGKEPNVSFYERHGFVVSEAAYAPHGGPRLRFMRWDP